ncbi:MAG: DNA-methyltransferase [Pyrinomonadaceae bacterium]
MQQKKATKPRASRNRTIALTSEEAIRYKKNIVKVLAPVTTPQIENKVILGDAHTILNFLPKQKFNLLFADPPYNLNKKFGTNTFKQTSLEAYEKWLDGWLSKCVKLLTPDASIYICGDWRSSSAIQRVGLKHFILRNRITWEREKGRGSKTNWKNASEDIWFFTLSENYKFNVEEVMVRKKVIAPYKEEGKPKDWAAENGGNFRLTHPSNLWNDLTVPFWSMPENTVHPTQKPEKLLAKIILASTGKNDLILDPFSGSGTSAVVAKKLGRKFTCIETDEDYCLLTEKRLELATNDTTIQGYTDGIFWERNSQFKK